MRLFYIRNREKNVVLPKKCENSHILIKWSAPKKLDKKSNFEGAFLMKTPPLIKISLWKGYNHYIKIQYY
jgi:hypothetical protein